MRKTLHQYYNEEDRTKCKLCHKNFKHLGSHIWHKHKIKAQEYKSRFELPHNISLIANSVEKKKRKHFNLHRTKYLSNLFTATALKCRFKKGNRTKRYIARRTIEVAYKNIKKYNQKEQTEVCPVCKQKFNHLDSHLFNKHQLIRVTKKLLKEGGVK